MIHIVCCDLLKLVPLLSIANIPIHPKDLIERVMVIENACQETPSKKQAIQEITVALAEHPITV